ncbi:hypothetical protein CENSYa_0583 [Cenarchaeum symbiosum A]|uniref:Uncharacterized protein n=1 Tax=Cenarchaeum symbiosum (strain A) TaxID=414004 RepID=A0RV49_CENSY|nr:hypothetical protein CENSYa_0583 [Cenarchaeum symbiosum A]
MIRAKRSAGILMLAVAVMAGAAALSGTVPFTQEAYAHPPGSTEDPGEGHRSGTSDYHHTEIRYRFGPVPPGGGDFGPVFGYKALIGDSERRIEVYANGEELALPVTWGGYGVEWYETEFRTTLVNGRTGSSYQRTEVSSIPAGAFAYSDAIGFHPVSFEPRLTAFSCDDHTNTVSFRQDYIVRDQVNYMYHSFFPYSQKITYTDGTEECILPGALDGDEGQLEGAFSAFNRYAPYVPKGEISSVETVRMSPDSVIEMTRTLECTSSSCRNPDHVDFGHALPPQTFWQWCDVEDETLRPRCMANSTLTGDYVFELPGQHDREDVLAAEGVSPDLQIPNNAVCTDPSEFGAVNRPGPGEFYPDNCGYVLPEDVIRPDPTPYVVSVQLDEGLGTLRVVFDRPILSVDGSGMRIADAGGSGEIAPSGNRISGTPPEVVELPVNASSIGAAASFADPRLYFEPSAVTSEVGAFPAGHELPSPRYLRTYSTGTELNRDRAVAFSSDGSSMVIGGLWRTFQGWIYPYVMTEKFDVSTAERSGKFLDVDDRVGLSIHHISFSDDGLFMFVTGNKSPKVFPYELTTPYTINSVRGRTPSPNIPGEGQLYGIAFSLDGRQMYTIGNSDTVQQFPLSEKFTVSTADVSSPVSFDVSAVEDDARGVAVSPDGKTMYVSGGGDVHAYTLVEKNDVSSARYETSFSISPQTESVFGIKFSPDGRFLFAVSFEGVHQYELSRPHDISGPVQDLAALEADGDSPSGMFIAPGGTDLYLTDDARGRLRWYDISSEYDLSTATLRRTQITTWQDSPQGVYFPAGRAEMYTVGSSPPFVHRLTLPGEYDTSSITEHSMLNVSLRDINPVGVALSGDGKKMLVAGGASGTVFQYGLVPAYNLNGAVYNRALDLGGPTPTDLAFSRQGDALYVSDDEGQVHHYALKPAYNIVNAKRVGSFLMGTESLHGLSFSDDGRMLFGLDGDAGTVAQFNFGGYPARRTAAVGASDGPGLAETGDRDLNKFLPREAGDRLAFSDFALRDGESRAVIRDEPGVAMRADVLHNRMTDALDGAITSDAASAVRGKLVLDAPGVGEIPT